MTSCLDFWAIESRGTDRIRQSKRVINGFMNVSKSQNYLIPYKNYREYNFLIHENRLSTFAGYSTGSSYKHAIRHYIVSLIKCFLLNGKPIH